MQLSMHFGLSFLAAYLSPGAYGVAEPVLIDLVLENLEGGTNGSAVIAIHQSWAPLGAARFLELVDRGFYDGHSFFRAVPHFVVQWGLHPDPQQIVRAHSFAPSILDDPLLPSVRNTRGKLTFAAAGPNTRDVQCFINLVDNPHLDSPSYSFAPFGEVISGMDSISSIYTGYGESVDQQGIHQRGDPFLRQAYPQLSRIKHMRKQAQPTAAPPTQQTKLPALAMEQAHTGQELLQQSMEEGGVGPAMGPGTVAACASAAAVLGLLVALHVCRRTDPVGGAQSKDT